MTGNRRRGAARRAKITLFILLAALLLAQMFSQALASPAGSAASDDKTPAKLVVGLNQSRVLSFGEGVIRVAVASPEIADVVAVPPAEVLIVGKSPGETSLHIWTADGRRSFLVEVAADDAAAAGDIMKILGYPGIRVSKIGKTVILEGTVNDQYQKSRAEKVAAAYGDKVVNLLEITRPVQVKIEAKVLEINRDKERDLGIKWGNDVNSPGTFNFGQSFVNPALGDPGPGHPWGYDAIQGQLNALIKSGSAKILSQPNMITMNGEKADIVVGGQIPVPVALQNGTVSIDWKEYGIRLEIAPEVNSEGLINNHIKAEVSSLDWTSTHRIQLGPNMYVPPIKTRKAESVIAMRSGQTMAIGGLIGKEETQDLYKVPILGDLPIIGGLFRSTSFSRNETELVILVTATLVNPEEYVPSATAQMNEFAKENPWGGDKKNEGKTGQGANPHSGG